MTVDETDGYITGRGWRGRKYYLSDEAVALLKAHCHGTPYSMSAALDLMIKERLGEAGPKDRLSVAKDYAPAEPAEDPALQELRDTIEAGKKAVAEISGIIAKHTDVRAESVTETIRRAQELTAPAVPPMTHTDIRSSQLMRDKTDEYERRADAKKQPNKKDFDLDI